MRRETVLHFQERIHQHDTDKLAEAMTEDQLFIDVLGPSLRGREKIRLRRRGRRHRRAGPHASAGKRGGGYRPLGSGRGKRLAETAAGFGRQQAVLRIHGEIEAHGRTLASPRWLEGDSNGRLYLFTAIACSSKCPPRRSDPAPMNSRAGKSLVVK